jgi:hypothetical protein
MNGQISETENIGYTRHKKKTNQTNKRLRKPKGQSRMHKPEKLTTLGIQDTRQRQTKQKTQTKQHSTLCVGHHDAQTTGGKDELNIVLCGNRKRTS